MKACFTTLTCDECKGDHYADEPCACLGEPVLEERLSAALRREAALKDALAHYLCHNRPTIIAVATPQ